MSNLALDGSSTNVTVVGDIADLENPVLLTTIPGSSDDVAANGELLLVLEVGADDDLRAFDVTTPAEPRELLVRRGSAAIYSAASRWMTGWPSSRVDLPT